MVKSKQANSNEWQNSNSTEKVSKQEESWSYEDITLSKARQGQGLGFTVAGGRDAPGGLYIDEGRGVFVQKIITGGVALIDGRLKPQDIIVSVNGVEVQGSTHVHVVQLLKNSAVQVHLRVKRRANMKGRFVEISLQKDPSVHGLGFSVSGGVGTPDYTDDHGIFVTQVFAGGVADRDGRMKVGDKIMSVGEVSLTKKTHDEAVEVLRSATTTTNIVVMQLMRKEPTLDKNKMKVENAIYSTVVKPEIRVPKNTNLEFQRPVIKQSYNNLHQPLATHPTPTPDKPRRIVLSRTSPNCGLGFNVVGGFNGRGIFVSQVLQGSLCSKQSDIKRGDKLLRVNQADLRDVTHGQAISALKNSGEHVVIITQYKPEELEELERWVAGQQRRKEAEVDDDDESKDIRSTQEDSYEISSKVMPSKDDIFLRSLYDYDPFLDVSFAPFSPAPVERLKVKFGEVFRISRINLSEEWWPATKVFSMDTNANNRNNNNNRNNKNNKNNNFGQEVGVIPGKMSAVLNSQKQKIPYEFASENSGELRTSKKRRSFILSSKLKTSARNVGSNNKAGSSYEPVILRQCLNTRPVVLFGPLKDKMNDLLVAKCPQLYDACVPHTTRPMRHGEISGREYVFVLTKEEMQRDIDNGKFLEVGIYNNHYYGISFDSVKAIARQHKHCLADISMETMPRLQAADLFPTIILLNPSSNNLLSSWLQTKDEGRLKSLQEQTNLLFKQHRHMFSAVVTGETEGDLFRGVRRVVEVHGRKYMWVASDEKI